MFGYIKAYKSELRVKDYEIYRAVYCTLCRELGRSFGPFARFTLNYDFTFLAVLMLSISPTCTQFERGRCAFNPLVKCNCYSGRREELTYSAAVAMCMLYYKLRDDMGDRGFWARLPRYLVYPFFASARKKAAALYPWADQIMAEMLNRQRKLESSGNYSVDEAAEPTAWALSRLFVQGVAAMEKSCSDGGQPDADSGALEESTEPSPQQRVLERLGYCLGRWVYLVDAMDDMAEDLRHGTYNPYLHRFGLTESDEGEIGHARQEILPGLNLCISEACAAFELLEIHHFREIIHNILYYGLEQVQNSVAAGTFRKSDRKEAK